MIFLCAINHAKLCILFFLIQCSLILLDNQSAIEPKINKFTLPISSQSPCFLRLCILF